jgi:hypothetical protein
MSRTKKNRLGKIDKGLTPEEQHALYVFLTKEPYHKGAAFLASKGINVSVSMVQHWFADYAAHFAFQEFQLSTSSIAEQLRNLGIKVTDANMKEVAAKLFERQAILNMQPDKFMRYYIEDRRLSVQEAALKLDQQKFERLKRIEDESRKALTAGGTEAELIAKWKQILNFDEQS